MWAPIAVVRGVIVTERTELEVLPAAEMPLAGLVDTDSPVRQLVAFSGRVAALATGYDVTGVRRY